MRYAIECHALYFVSGAMHLGSQNQGSARYNLITIESEITPEVLLDREGGKYLLWVRAMREGES